ncbi:MAG: LUD domain-containing protein [Flavipsychrobacter sp.]|nr:LUD domain-containing protein [Flavipsychrobacter sp.]
MSNRDKILSAVKQNQPTLVSLPEVAQFDKYFTESITEFKKVCEGIGATLHFTDSYESIILLLEEQFATARPVVTSIPELAAINSSSAIFNSPQEYENIELVVIKAQLGVAENGAVWITEADVLERALPFITQHLAVVLHKDMLVATMHDAYKLIGKDNYGWGTFIAGPSKTADIEQSLVLGAHGPRTMTIFIMGTLL